MSLAKWRAWVSKAKEVGEIKSAFDWARVLVDGNLFIQIFEQSPKGHLVGTDYHGNKYYENKDLPYDRCRWVIYADKTHYNPTSIPPEWHGWVNYINDYPPSKYEYKKPVYHIEASVSKTGMSEFYQPKGTWYNPQRRNWTKYEAWQPPGAGK